MLTTPRNWSDPRSNPAVAKTSECFSSSSCFWCSLSSSYDYTRYFIIYNCMKRQEANGDRREHDRMAKVLVIGDGGVGKTAMISRFTDDRFEMSYTATIGVDFKSKLVKCGDTTLKLQIWDTAGQ